MFHWFLFVSVCFVLVKTHPLIQNVQPYPVTSHQQYVYRPPYSEAIVVQPSQINQYSQPVSIKTPLPPYQTLHGSVTDQLSKICVDKILSNPSLRHLILPNKIVGNEHNKDIYANSLPHNNGGVVNNYIIVPPDNLKINDTITKRRKTKRVKNDLICPIKEYNTLNKRKKKLCRDNTQDVKSSNTKKPRKVKEDIDQSWSFKTDNIKCFTPADILGNEKYEPEKRTRSKNIKKQCQRKSSDKKPKLSGDDAYVNKSHKNKKTKTNKVQKMSVEDRNSKCQKKKENAASMTPKKIKSKQCEKELKSCKCAEEDKQPDCETKIIQNAPQICNQDTNELYLSNLLQQGCINLENRRTRNSKADTAIKDFHTMYPDLPSDISKSLATYMNDFFSPHSLQNVPTFSSLPGSKYPFDFSQLYQIPQYSNTDLNKLKGNTESNKSSRRKKKKKKKNSKIKIKNGNVGNNDDIYSETSIPACETNIETSEKNSQISDNTLTAKANTQALESNNQVLNKTIQMEIHIPKQSSDTNIESVEKVDDIIEEITPVSRKINITDSTFKEPVISTDIDLEYFTEPIENTKEVLKDTGSIIYDETCKTEELSKEIYETQIPNSIPERRNNEKDFEILKHEVPVINEMPPTIDSTQCNKLSEWGSEDELFNILLHDYYPDFRADNLAYLASDEEMDFHGIHDRYFYLTDRNTDLRETNSPAQTNHLSNGNRFISTEDQLENHDMFQLTDNANVVEEKNGPQGVVFRTPPALDVPDFITRKINKDKQDSNEIYYQHRLEDDFDRFNLDSFADKSNNIVKTAKRYDDENSGHLVETVYARSKVVKYGQGQEIIKSDKHESKTNSNFDDGINDGDKIIVIAKSFRPEDYW